MTIRIEEAEAVRDFARVMEYVRAGDVVHLERDGAETALICQPELPIREAYSIDHVLERLQKAEHHSVMNVPDPSFADDLQVAHESINRPMDVSSWD